MPQCNCVCMYACICIEELCYMLYNLQMTAEPRAATIRVCEEKTVCLLFSRSVYEEIISGSSALLGQGDALGNVDWSKDHETRSLFRHVVGFIYVRMHVLYA